MLSGKLFRPIAMAYRSLSQKADLSKSFTALTMPHVTVIQTKGGRCVAEMPVSKNDTNTFGTMHGGLTATLIDEVTTYALMSCSPGQTGGMSVNLNITYISAARLGETIVIEADTVKCGKTLAFLNCTLCEKKSQRIIATGTHTKYVGQGVPQKAAKS